MIAVSSLVFLSLISYAFGDKTVGFPEWLAEDQSNSECTVDGVPPWLEGTFVRHQCGAFGGPKGLQRRSVSHFYDCVGMLNMFKFNRGRVTFSSRYFDTSGYQSWSPKQRDSSTTTLPVSWATLFSPIDSAPASNDQSNPNDPQNGGTTVDASPGGGIWAQDGTACTMTAYSDAPDMYNVRMSGNNAQALRRVDYKTQNAVGGGGGDDLPQDSVVLHNSAHSREDADGNLWGAMLMARKRAANSYELSRLVYKLESKTGKRTFIQNAFPVVIADLSQCTPNQGSWVYTYKPGFSDAIGYVSEVATTGTYVVLIENPFVFNPCALLDQAKANPKPFLQTWFTWRGSQVPLKFHLITKADGRLKKTAATLPEAKFISRVINVVENSAETKGYVVVDALAYPNADFLLVSYRVNDLLSGAKPIPEQGRINRYTIDPNEVMGVGVASLHGNKLPAQISADFATTNRASFGSASQAYVYLIQQPYTDTSTVVKLNVADKKSDPIVWTPDNGVYPAGEPTFVPKSKQGGGNEDDGVLLVPAFNSNTKKGLLIILDGASMKQVGRVEAPDLITFGTYSRFLPSCTDGASGLAISSILFLCVMVFGLFVR